MDESLKMKYFVLKPKGTDAYAKASRDAMEAYAQSIGKENPRLALDLQGWARMADLNCRAAKGEFDEPKATQDA